MIPIASLTERLRAVAGVLVRVDEPLALHTRFALGGAAALYVECAEPAALTAVAAALKDERAEWTLVGGGTNLVCADAGYAGVVVHYTGAALCCDGATVTAQAGATLQALVDLSLEHGLEGIDKMTGIPGSVGGAVYGNAGAYGQSISDTLASVRAFDGNTVRTFTHAECNFRYRDSLFKQTHDYVVLEASFALRNAVDADAMRRASNEILATRNAKFPSDLRCAGSVFKNLLLAELPERARNAVPENVVKKGKVPAGWFLDQVNARGFKHGGIEVASYHANLLYNAGGATAADFRAVVAELKRRVEERFGLRLEEEVQYLGVDAA